MRLAGPPGDAYGGSIANRARPPLEITDAVISVWGAERVGYLHVTEPVTGPLVPEEPISPILRSRFQGAFMVNGGYDEALGHQAIRNGEADLVAYGTLFLANPDLPRRFDLQTPLNDPDPSTYHGGDKRGYTDYPTLDDY